MQINKNFFIKENFNKKIEVLIGDKNWKVIKIDFDNKYLAIMDSKSKSIMINNFKPEYEKFNEYIMAHEYFRILENSTIPMSKFVLKANKIDELDTADLFAYLYLRVNDIDAIPESVNKLFSKYPKMEEKIETLKM